MTKFKNSSFVGMADDYPIPTLFQWRNEGLKTTLVTLVSLDGAAPRPIGAQMLVREDGNYLGYLSGGCLEQAVVLEAQTLMQKNEKRLVRYGKKSPYFDVKLPCGSGLDLYFDTDLDFGVIFEMFQAYEKRVPFSLVTNLKTGISELKIGINGIKVSYRHEDYFIRVYLPPPRLVVLGSGPSLSSLCQISKTMGLEFLAWCPDDHSRTNLAQLGFQTPTTPALPDHFFESLDPYTATVLLFHEHDCEPDILERVLRSPCFYIGALGNSNVHRHRMEELRKKGFDQKHLDRIFAPIGTISNAKSKTSLAVGIIAQILSAAKEADLFY